MYSPKRGLVVITLLTLVLAVAVPPSAPAGATKLTVGYPTTAGAMSVLWVTTEAGLFDKHGLDVTLMFVGGSSKIVQSMLAGELPLAETAIPAVIQANLAGADLVMLAGPNHKPGQKLMVKSEIQSPADLKGRKLGVTRFGTSDDFLMRYILKKWGLQPDLDVTLIQMGGSQETLAGLASGGIDGGGLSSPLNLRAQKLGFRMLVDLSAIGVDYQGAGVVTTRRFVRDNPDTIRRYLKAYVEGLHRLKTDKAFSLQVLAKYTRTTERDFLEDTYQHYAIDVMPKVPYPTMNGIRMVLDEIGSQNPKARDIAAASLVDLTHLKEIEASGFIKTLYGEAR
jgi:NitT/TauT family transport system substrate-binding protein